MMLRRAIIALLILLFLSTSGAAWTGVYLLERAADSRAQQSERADARTEQVRQDVAEILDELQNPDEDTTRFEVWRTARRIEEKLDRLLEEETP